MRNTLAAVSLAAALLIGCEKDPVERGIDCLRLGDYAMAKSFFNEQLRREPTHFDARVGMGKALLQEARARDGDTARWREALVHLQAARSIESREFLFPLLSEAWFLYARAMLRAHDTVAALTALTFSLDNQPDNTAALNLAGILYAGYGRTSVAESSFVRALNIDSSNTDILFNLGLLCWYRGDYECSVSYWRRLAELDSTDTRVRRRLELARRRTKETAQ